MTNISATDIIIKNGAVPVFYHNDLEVCKQVVKICYKNGFRVFEFTNRGTNAAQLFVHLKMLVNTDMPDMLLGAGTIFTLQDAEEFANIGADFIVSPILNSEVAQYCNERELLWIPGCVTPTEIYQARLLGAQIIKLFPGDLLGASYVKSIRPVFPDVNFMPTGGVTTQEDNLRQWFEAGVSAVGMGSQLFPKNMIDTADWDALSKHVGNALQTVHKIIE